jgi:iron(III) transport system substrate-binding protein
MIEKSVETKAMPNSDRRHALARLAAGMGWAALPLSLPLTARAQAPTPADWNKLVEAAKKEGKLVVYTAAAGQPSHGLVAKAFEQKYGITVTYLEARASEIRERVRTEQAAGRFIGDLSHNGSTTSSLQEVDGAFDPYGSLPSLSRLRAPFKAGQHRVPCFAMAYSILINTNLVKPADEPKSWVDLTAPKWKGKILSDDMRALGGGAVTFFVLYDKLGRGFHEKLAMNQLVFSRDLRASERRVARGDYPIWIPMSVDSYGDLKGLPVKMLQPQEGYPYITYELALLKNAPRPNAARLFMEFFLSDEAQLIQDQHGLIMVTDTAAPKGSEEANARRNGKLLGTTDATRQDELLKIAKEIYK